MCLWEDENLHSCIYLLRGLFTEGKKSQLWMGFFHCPELGVHHHEIGEGGRQREALPVLFRVFTWGWMNNSGVWDKISSVRSLLFSYTLQEVTQYSLFANKE